MANGKGLRADAEWLGAKHNPRAGQARGRVSPAAKVMPAANLKQPIFTAHRLMGLRAKGKLRGKV